MTAAALPALPSGADIRSITDRVNALIRGRNRRSPVVVADLPGAATVAVGTQAFVTDANATTFASVVAGGGANAVPVYSDGANWRIG